MSTSEQVIDKVKLTQTIFLNLTQDFYKIRKNGIIAKYMLKSRQKGNIK